MSFDMHVSQPLDMEQALGLETGGWPFEKEQSERHVYEVVLQIQGNEAPVTREAKGATGAAGGFRYVPVSVARREAWGPTWTADDEAMQMGRNPFGVVLGNMSQPLGYEQLDLGVARMWRPPRERR